MKDICAGPFLLLLLLSSSFVSLLLLGVVSGSSEMLRRIKGKVQHWSLRSEGFHVSTFLLLAYPGHAARKSSRTHSLKEQMSKT